MYWNLLFQRFLLLNMFRATHRSSSGAQTVFTASGFTYVCVAGRGRQPQTYVKPEAVNTV
jgi:hypothetical protein